MSLCLSVDAHGGWLSATLQPRTGDGGHSEVPGDQPHLQLHPGPGVSYYTFTLVLLQPHLQLHPGPGVSYYTCTLVLLQPHLRLHPGSGCSEVVLVHIYTSTTSLTILVLLKKCFSVMLVTSLSLSLSLSGSMRPRASGVRRRRAAGPSVWGRARGGSTPR